MHVGFLQFWASCKCVVCAYLLSSNMSKTVWCFFRFLHFMSLQCFVTTTRAALTARYSINPRLGLSLTHLPPSEDRRFRQTWVGLDIRRKKKNAFMSRCDLFKWDLEPGSEILFSRVYRTSFFITRWEMLVCVSSETSLERFGKELGLSRSKEYKPWSLHLSQLPYRSPRTEFFWLNRPLNSVLWI